MMLAIVCITVVGLSSCDKSLNEPMASPQKMESSFEDTSPSVVETRSASNWYVVEKKYRDRYRSSYNKASSNSYENVKKYFISVGFFTAINAVNGFSLKDLGVYSLDALATYNPDYSWFGNIDNLGYLTEKSFKKDILAFVKEYKRPVVVLADTNVKWLDEPHTNMNILIVWEVSDSGVKITRISDIPSSSFKNNLIFELTWSDFFTKAKNATGSGIANVAYPHSDPH